MLANRDIIVFGEDWGRFPSTTQHIGKVLLEHNRVMWIGSLGHRRPEFSVSDLKRVVGKIASLFRRPEQKGEQVPNLILVFPFIIPLHDIPVVRRLNALLLRYQLRRAMLKAGFTNPVLITSSPMAAGIVGTLGESSSHYFCLDDYSHFAGAFRHILTIEQQLLQKVSAAYSVSDALVASRVPASGRSYFLPQGVNSTHFSKRLELPPRVAGIKKPIAGFFGLVSTWMDINLMVFLARRNPDISFVILGRSSVDTSPFNGFANIHFLGEIPFAELPAYASCFDVGLISFVVNELTVVCNPLKLLEYLSLGIPVVSTNLPEVAKFGDAVYLARDYQEFESMMKEAIAADSPEKREYRLRIANSFSWKNITETICGRIIEIEQGNSHNV